MSNKPSELQPNVRVDPETGDEPPVVVGEVEEAAEVHGQAGRFSWKRILAYGVLPGLALVLALGAGYLKWQADSARQSQAARTESVQAATDSTIALLSYRPDTVDKDLGAARDLLTGTFRDAYDRLIDDVVIPGAKQKQISAEAEVPAAAAVSATENHAAVLVFVNQTIIVGNDPPTSTASSVRVTLEKTHDRWLISQFDPRLRRASASLALATAPLFAVTMSMAPPARADAVAYLVNVTMRPGYNVANAEHALSYGHGIGAKVADGVAYPQIMADVKADFNTTDEYQASYLITQAANGLCPAVIWQLRKTAAHYQPPAP